MPIDPNRIDGADTHLADDIVLCIINEGGYGEIWINRCQYLRQRLALKVKRGTYDPVLAGRAWRYVVEDYWPTYKREQGVTGRIDAPTRNLAGRLLEEREREQTYATAGVTEPAYAEQDAQLRAMEV